ncbi:MAG: hypothetical protein ACFE9C_13180 [Candidatus Hodarchaeota archaeon]
MRRLDLIGMILTIIGGSIILPAIVAFCLFLRNKCTFSIFEDIISSHYSWGFNIPNRDDTPYN